MSIPGKPTLDYILQAIDQFPGDDAYFRPKLSDFLMCGFDVVCDDLLKLGPNVDVRANFGISEIALCDILIPLGA